MRKDKKIRHEEKNVMKKRVKKMMFLVGMSMLLGLSACEYSGEEMETMSGYEENAEKNAIAYVEQKYGFTPRVVSVECTTIDSEFEIELIPKPTGYAFIKVHDKDADKDFWVYSRVTEENTENCWDAWLAIPWSMVVINEEQMMIC